MIDAVRRSTDRERDTSPSASALDRPGRRIAGMRIGLLDISKPRGDVFLDQLESRLTPPGRACSATASRRSPSRRRSTCATRSPRSATS